MKTVIDLSQEIYQGRPSMPGQQPPVVFPMTRFEEKQDGRWTFAVNTLLVSEHTGTHTETFPAMEDESAGLSVDIIPLDRFIGPAVCLDVRQMCESGVITSEHVKHAAAPFDDIKLSGRIVLLYSGIYKRCFPTPQYISAFLSIDSEALDWFKAAGVEHIGVDAAGMSVVSDGNKQSAARFFSERRMLLTKNLNDLEPISGKSFRYIGLPVKVRGGVSGLSRAIAVLEED